MTQRPPDTDALGGADNEVQEDDGKGLKPSTLFQEIKKVRLERLKFLDELQKVIVAVIVSA